MLTCVFYTKHRAWVFCELTQYLFTVFIIIVLAMDTIDSLTKINKKSSRRWQKFKTGHFKVSTAVKVAETKSNNLPVKK